MSRVALSAGRPLAWRRRTAFWNVRFVAPAFIWRRRDASVIAFPCLAQGTDLVESLLSRSAPPEGGIKFVPTICPNCGWDMEGKKETAVMLCRNCDSAWALSGHVFTEVRAVVVSPPQTDENAVYLPFWRMKAGFDKLELTSRADLIRIANLPRAITAELAETPLYFWSPAFKINSNLYQRLCRQMTIFCPAGEEKGKLPRTGIYPASLPWEEGVEGSTVNLAGMIMDKKRLYPQLSGIAVSVEEYRPEYHPFSATAANLSTRRWG